MPTHGPFEEATTRSSAARGGEPSPYHAIANLADRKTEIDGDDADS